MSSASSNFTPSFYKRAAFCHRFSDALDENFAGNVGFQRQFRLADAHDEARPFLLQHQSAAWHESINGQRVATMRVLAIQAHQFAFFAFRKLVETEQFALRRGALAAMKQRLHPPKRPRFGRKFVTTIRTANQVAKFAERARMRARRIAFFKLKPAKRAMQILIFFGFHLKSPSISQRNSPARPRKMQTGRRKW
jgi:hypothetical protein